MKKILTIILGVALASCKGVEPKEITGPSGGKAYSMECSGFPRTPEKCWQKASEICPDGYDIVNQQQQNLGGGTVFNVIGNTVIANNRNHTSSYMLIECKNKKK